MSKGVKIGLVAVGLVVIGCAVAVVVKKKRNAGTEVTVAKAVRQVIVQKVTANGKVQAEKKVDLSALVMGQIVNLNIKEGDQVSAGDLLLQIDRNRATADEAGASAALRSAQSDLESSRLTMEQARRDHERATKNFAARILPEAEYQRARAALENATAASQAARNRVEQFRAGVNASRDTLSKTTVLAPIDGMITSLRVKAGEVTVLGTMNNPGTQLMTISDMSSVLAVLMVDETDMPTVAVGQKAVLMLDSYPGKPLDGTVIETGHSPITRDDPDLVGLTTTSDAINFKVKVKIDNPPASIRPGFSVTADIITSTRTDVVSIPLAAVVVRDSPTEQRTASGKLKTEEGVYLFEGDKARFVPITVGIAGELQVEVVEGLAAGQEIVSGPFQALRKIKDGDPVRRMPEEKKEKLAAEKTASS